MEFSVDKPPTAKEYLLNLDIKMKDDEFLGDTNLLLCPDEKYNPNDAYNLVSEFIKKYVNK